MFLSTEKCFIYQGPATWEVFLASEFNQETTACTVKAADPLNLGDLQGLAN